MARELGMAMYLECSALSGEGVPELFNLAAKLPLLRKAGLYSASSSRRDGGHKKGKCALQ